MHTHTSSSACLRIRLITVASLAMLLLLQLVPAAHAASSVTHHAFRYQRTIPASSGQEEIAAATLDPETWKHLQPKAPDLCVISENDSLVPHLLRRATAKRLRRVRTSCAATVQALRELPDNRIEIDLEIPDNQPTADTLVLATPLRDFERRISIDGISPGQSEPHRLVTDALIYDYSRFLDLRHLSVDIPPNDFRLLRVTIEAVTDTTQAPSSVIARTIREETETTRTETSTLTERPFRIDHASLYIHRDQPGNREPLTLTYPLTEWTAQTNTKSQTTTYLITTANLPLSALLIDTPTRNFSRRASVEVPVQRDGRTQWRTIADATLSRISFRAFSQHSLALTFPEQQHPTMRLILHHGDAPPLELSAISGHGPQWQALFIAQPNTTYRLMIGADSAPAPSFDTSHLDTLLARSDIQPLTCTLGPLTENPDYNPRAERSRLAWLGSRTLFGIGILLVIAILARGLVRASKIALNDTTPEDPASGPLNRP